MHKSFLAEFTGTFTMIFCGCGAIMADQQFHSLYLTGIAMVWGLVVCAMIFTFGDISGAHFNPAVTLSFWLSKRMPGRQVLPYFLAQFTGAATAVLFLKFIFPFSSTLGETQPSIPVLQAFIFESILTFILVLVILNVSTGSKEKGITAAIAIGATIGLEALAAGSVTGASMNPFRSFVPALVNWNLEHVWIYLTAPFVGSILAVLLHLQFYKVS